MFVGHACLFFFFFLVTLRSISTRREREKRGREEGGLSTICVKVELVRNSHVRPVSGIDDVEAVGCGFCDRSGRVSYRGYFGGCN